ncbi:hypothetical protein MRO96_17430, partial [Dickeya dianthicola]|uniref:hypothetical protein n=1 Tax=Dickeya dianthicola TaxID=204039 RepID=UPI001F6073E2
PDTASPARCVGPGCCWKLMVRDWDMSQSWTPSMMQSTPAVFSGLLTSVFLLLVAAYRNHPQWRHLQMLWRRLN